LTLLLAWVAFPLLFAALAFGCGLLLEEVTGRLLPGPLLLPAGFALVLVVCSLTTMDGATARLTAPAVVALAVTGVGLRIPFRPRPDLWAVVAPVAVFCAYAAPIVLTGSATFAGYISLDDTADWLGFADRAITHGRDLSGLPLSSYSAVLHDNFPSGYPLGSVVPLGLGHELTRVDAAWLFQPYLAFLSALLALALFALVAPLVRGRPLRVLVAFVGAQPALLYGYAFWGGVKEVTVAYLVALSATLGAAALRAGSGIRGQLPLAVAAAALLVCQSALGVVWLAGLGLFAVLLCVANGTRRASLSLVLGLACAALLATPALAVVSRFARGADVSDSGHGSLGNLFHPLSVLQLGGIWPVGDFRGRPTHMAVSYLLLGVLAAAAVYALVRALQRRAWGLPLYLSLALAGFALVRALHALGHGSPWLDAKALASASPCLLGAGLTGGALLAERRRLLAVVAGAGVLALLGAGVLWSNALAYGDVWLAPRAQLAELETIGQRFAGEGPTLMTEYQPYGVRHFLRALAPEGASERRARPVTLRTGGVLDKAQYADPDAFELGSVLVYRTLVLRRSPFASRPPSGYVPVWQGRFYEVWQRLPTAGRIVAHLSLGSESDPEAIPDCSEVERLGTEAARAGGTLVAATRPEPQVVDLSRTSRPSDWPAGATPGTVLPEGAGTLTSTVVLPSSVRQFFWLGGSFRDRVRLSVDGEPIGSQRGQLEETAQLVPLGSARLRAGAHVVELRYDGFGWQPGSRGAPFLLGPLVFGPPATAAALLSVSPAAAASLCNRPLDWVEAVAPG
jgi:hypothetical protein